MMHRAREEERAPEGGSYTVRPYRASDLDGVASLRRLVLGGEREDAEFLWKARDAPYASHGRTAVAEREGEIVGVAGTVGLPFRVDGRTVMAAQFVDSLVHPAHRRRGVLASLGFDLFDHASEWADLHYAFPMPTASKILRDGESIADIIRDAGVDLTVTSYPEYYLVQRPSALRPRGPTSAVRAIEAAAGTAARTWRRFRSSPSGRTSRIDVERHETVPVDRLADLHRRTLPEAPHLVREADLYRWRFAHPKWDYVAYTAREGGRTVAAVVAGSLSFGPDLTMTRLTEVLPLDAAAVDEAILADLISAAIADHPESAVVVAGGTSLPTSTLDSFGFRPGDSRLLSATLNSPIFYQTSLAYLPIESTDGGERPLDDWRLTFFGPEIG